MWVIAENWLYSLRKFLLRYDFFKRIFARRFLKGIDSIDIRARADVEHQLVRMGRPVIGVLVAHMHSSDPRIRATALRSLATIDPELARPHILHLTRDRNPEVAAEAGRMVANLDPAEPDGSTE